MPVSIQINVYKIPNSFRKNEIKYVIDGANYYLCIIFKLNLKLINSIPKQPSNNAHMGNIITAVRNNNKVVVIFSADDMIIYINDIHNNNNKYVYF